jgi:lactoylglutathione lyase
MFTTMMGVAYPVKDVSAAYEFYSEKLGIRETVSGDFSTWAAMRVGEKTLMLVAANAKLGGAKPGHGAGVLFGVRYLLGAVTELQRRGIQVSSVIDVPNGGRAAYFHDPDGNSLGVFEAAHGPVNL